MSVCICPVCGKKYAVPAAFLWKTVEPVCFECGVRDSLTRLGVSKIEQEDILVSIQKYKEQQLRRVIDAVNEFSEREYEGGQMEKIRDDGVIPIAYTTYDFDDGKEHDIQVDFDINEIAWKNYIDGKLVLTQQLESLEDFIQDIEGCSFDDVIFDCIEEGCKSK